MHVGLAVNVHEPLSATLERSVIADDAGVDSLWIVDFPGSRFAPPVAAIVASKTSTNIGIGLMSPLMYSPEYLAQIIETLVIEYGERFEIMLGAGDRQALQNVGIGPWIPSKVVEDVAQAATRVRAILAEKEIKCTVWIGAQGPKMIGASLVSDGVLLNLTEPSMIKWAANILGSKSNEFRVGAFAPTVITDDDIAPSKEFLFSAAIVALGAPNKLLQEFDLLDAFKDARTLFRKRGTIDKEILSMLDKDSVNRFGLFGSVDTVSEYMKRASRSGLDSLILGPPASNNMQGITDLLRTNSFNKK
ncbi:MAG: LLM class flavin-dependent oxidoreductase [Candidatus Thorarchaeota archaeon]|jgi:alkanesulfonate monooxygenase SsuD/methylene tetrahydromethanopterin reductase-like flavin-dependent oxidoreductase (luciferase family)